MDLTQLLLTRRSIRRYTGHPLSDQDLEAILSAGLLAPSSRGRRPWELVVVRERAMLEQLSHCRQGSARMLAGAAAAILVFADPTQSDVWTEDCSLVLGNMHLMAHALGLGSCWVQGRLRNADEITTEEYVRERLGFPENYKLEAILTLGMPDAEAPAHQLDELPMEKIKWERY